VLRLHNRIIVLASDEGGTDQPVLLDHQGTA
jgi:hypothetical protein